MSCDACCKREKLFQHRINGCTHPFIDENLQLRLPGLEASTEDHNAALYHPLYAYYSAYFSPFPPPLSIIDVERAVAEAQHAYEVWKRAQQLLQEKLQHAE